MNNGNLFGIGDKAFFDALAQSSVTKPLIRHFFLKRGIIISETTDRKTLALHLSRLTPDYRDFHELSEILQPTDSRDKLTSKRITTPLSIKQIELAAHQIKEAIEEDGFTATIKVFQDKIVAIEIAFQEQNFNRNEFRQTISKTAEISFEHDSEGTTVRYQHNRSVEDWAARTISLIQERIEEDLEVHEIDLSHIESPEVRTRFFVELMDGIEGYPLSDVTDAYAYNPKKESGKLAVDDGVHITKASLKGEGILRSVELKKLLDQWFFISKVIWCARSDDSSDLYEFEATFTEPETCTGFTYLPRGFFRYEHGEHAMSRTPLPESSDRTLSKRIESAAHRVLQSLQSKP